MNPRLSPSDSRSIRRARRALAPDRLAFFPLIRCGLFNPPRTIRTLGLHYIGSVASAII